MKNNFCLSYTVLYKLYKPYLNEDKTVLNSILYLIKNDICWVILVYFILPKKTYVDNRHLLNTKLVS